MYVPKLLLFQSLSFVATGATLALLVKVHALLAKVKAYERRVQALARKAEKESEETRKAMSQVLSLVSYQIRHVHEATGKLHHRDYKGAAKELSQLLERMTTAIEMQEFFLNGQEQEDYAPHDLNHVLELVAGELPGRCELEFASYPHALLVHAPLRPLMLALEHVIAYIAWSAPEGRVRAILMREGDRAKIEVWTARDAAGTKEASPHQRIMKDSPESATAGLFIRSINGELKIGESSADPSAEFWLPLVPVEVPRAADRGVTLEMGRELG